MKTLRNYIGGEWVTPSATEYLDLTNPATGEMLGRVPLSGTREVDAAVAAAQAAFLKWREVPPVARARYLFKLKYLMEQHFEEIAATVTRENGKTLDEARGSVRRGIENVEHACGIPTLMMGKTLEDVAAGIDCEYVRQPLGVFAAVTPFNFPAMVPCWFWPYAIATGNTFILKPSEQVPFSPTLMLELAHEAGIPAGVLNMVHGAKDAVNALLAHPGIAGISFVGSSPVAKHVYLESAKHGKRVQALGGAKNHVIVMPDADMDRAVANISESLFGCAGQRCLAGSVVVAAVTHVSNLDEGIDMVQRSGFANATSIFTQSGKAAREFRYRVGVSMIGVNIGVAAPMAFFPFGGTKGSFFGDLKAHGQDSIEFYTDKKVVISRW